MESHRLGAFDNHRWIIDARYTKAVNRVRELKQELQDAKAEVSRLQEVRCA